MTVHISQLLISLLFVGVLSASGYFQATFTKVKKSYYNLIASFKDGDTLLNLAINKVLL